MRGLAYDKKGEYERATIDFNKAIEINPKYAEVYNNRKSTKKEAGGSESAGIVWRIGYQLIGIIIIISLVAFFLLRRFYKKQSVCAKKNGKKVRPSVLQNKDINLETLVTQLDIALKQIKQINTPFFKDTSDRLKILRENLKSRLLVTVLGEFSSGKSTFINALIHEKLLPMKIKPTTATITKLQSGNKRTLKVYFNNGENKEYNINDLHTLTVENFVKEENILDNIHYVQVDLQNELLSHIDIADTPGFNSQFERHSKITADFIAHSDVVFWLLDANQMEKKSHRIKK